MHYTDFGNTGLKTSVAGLGCGGHSRLGMATGASTEHSVSVVSAAIDLGVTLFDTAAVYKTETIVGQAIKGRRDKLFLSTKAQVASGDKRTTAVELRASLEQSLTQLGTDYIDVFNLHGVALKHYDYSSATLVPELLKFRDEGKIRFLGITEQFIVDPSHNMLARALQDDIWDVMMIGFNLLNPSARKTVFPHTRAKGIATQIMFAVRKALSQPEALSELLQGLVSEGLMPADACDAENPLGFLLDDAPNISNAAYRFCRHEPGVETVLTGTSNIEHLRENVAAINQDPLSEKSTEHLRALFGHVDSVSGN